MSKIQLFLLSLVGAGPAGFLTYLLCMYLIDQPAGASSTVMIFAILTVLCTAPLVLMPLLILALYHSNYDPPKVPKASKKQPEVADDDDEDVEAEELEDEDEPASKKSKKSKKGKKNQDEEEEEDEEMAFVEEDD